jgi:hypothetical protein
MRTTQRLLAVAGMTLFTGFAIALTGSAASAASNHDSAAAAGPPTAQVRSIDAGVHIAGIYPSRRLCNAVGRAGEWRHRWVAFDCVPIRNGHAYVLRTFNDWRHDGWDHGGRDHGGWDHGGRQGNWHPGGGHRPH